MFEDFWRTNVPKSSDFDWFQQVLDEMFPSAASDIRSVPRGAFPMINMGRTDEAILVYVFAPGLKAEQLELSVQDNVLTLSGTREPASTEREGPQRAYYRRERFGGEFSRTIALPDGVDTERTEARAAHGVVEIRLPKREEMKPRRVEIKAA